MIVRSYLSRLTNPQHPGFAFNARIVRADGEVRHGDNPRVTITIGVAELASGEACDLLLRRAEQALYVAKREGRNVLRLAA